MESERRSQRYPSHRPLQIRCETWTEFVETYASDICRGGMFIRCEDTPEVLSEVELKLSLPDRVEVSLLARVVHVVPVDQAVQTNRIPGMGVEFVHPSPEQKRQVLQLVEFARTQHEAGGDPNASFAHTLLENSASMPVRDVGARLSMMPEGGDNAARARKASQTMAAVQVNEREERPDASQVGMRTRPRSSTNIPIVRTPTEPVGNAAGRSSASTPIVRTATQPLGNAGATGRSSANNPIVRTQTGPLGSGTGRSSANYPLVRTPSGPLGAAGGRPNSASINRAPSAPIDPALFGSNRPGERAQSGPISGSPRTSSGVPEGGAPSGPAPSQSGQPAAPPKPTDLNRLKIVLNSLAHKHYEVAAKEAREMLIDNPGDPQVLKWQAICFARMALARNEPAAAAEYYTKVLRYEENNREARDFVKAFTRERKLEALPFGRYFLKKK